jgi:hypothetical protein
MPANATIDRSKASDLPSLADLWELSLEVDSPNEAADIESLESGLRGQWTLRTMKVTQTNRRVVCVFEPDPGGALA